MNQNTKKALLEKYHTVGLDEAETLQLEEYIEAGWVEPEELEDFQQMSFRLSDLAEDLSSQRMRERFQEQLGRLGEQQSRQIKNGWAFFRNGWSNPALRWAILLWLPVMGWGLAYFQFRDQGQRQPDLAAVQQELESLRAVMMMALLEKESSSERLKAVHLVREIDLDQAGEKITDALFATLNEDPNPNVRLACIDELSRYADSAKVREKLIKAIQHQDSPLVLLSLADVMIALGEKRSLEPFKKAFDRASTPPEVRKDILSRLERAI